MRDGEHTAAQVMRLQARLARFLRLKHQIPEADIDDLTQGWAARFLNSPKPIADITKAQADAAAGPIQALENVEEAAIQVGSLVIFKATSADGIRCIVIKTLTTVQLRMLKENPTLLDQPLRLLRRLERREETQAETRVLGAG